MIILIISHSPGKQKMEYGVSGKYYAVVEGAAFTVR